MRPAPPSIRPCSPMLRAPQKVCVGGFFLGQGAHSSHSWKVCVGQNFTTQSGVSFWALKKPHPLRGEALLLSVYFLAVAEFLAITFKISFKFARV